MAYISYVSEDQISPDDHVADRDHIIQISAVHPRFMRRHYELYIDLMVKNRGSLSRIQREIIAVVVSGLNGCYY